MSEITDIAMQGIAQTEVIMLKFFIKLLENYGDDVPLLITTLKQDLKEKEAKL